MRKLALAVSTLVMSMAMYVGVSAADNQPAEAINLKNFNLSWSDEFKGDSLDSNTWTPQIGNGIEYGNRGGGNNEKEYYKAENVSVSDGTMKIKAQTEKTVANGTTYNWTSARITSAGKQNIGLGYVEAKIKIPSSVGIWPAFWMLGTNGKTWPACGEIDIMEAFNTRTDIQSTIHYPKWNGADQYIYTNRHLTGDNDKTQWHTYGCYRDGKVCAFYIDGTLLKIYGTWTDKYVSITNFNETFSTADLTTGSYAGKRSVLNDDYYLLFNVACGGNLAQGNPPYTTDWSATMEVDYVRYYKEKTPEQIAADKKKEEEAKKKEEEAKKAEEAKKKAEAAAKAKPKKATISKAKNVKKRKIQLTFKKISGIKGYQVRWCDNKKFQGYEQKNTTKRALTLKGLDKKTKYFIKARAYKVYKGKKIYGAWSTVKKVKVNK